MGKEPMGVIEEICQKLGAGEYLFSDYFPGLEKHNASSASAIWDEIIELEGLIKRIEEAEKDNAQGAIPHIRTLLYTILILQIIGSRQKYPHRFMKKTELEEMGFSEEYLMYAFRSKKNDFASKNNPTKEKSSIIFDTDGFEAWRKKDIQAQVRAMPRGGA